MELNGEVRQRGFTKDMLFTVDEIISHISRYMTLRIGDLIYTGTPVGVGAVKAGDNIKARIGGHTLLDFDVM
jgi:2-keto-4-pentenoate hydratase/2-oxohepta-3-ene-1,7-dioic acid hydratase in catechol pathway